jgi:flavorubredoxin
MIKLYDKDGHSNMMIDDLGSGSMVQANQHIIVHGKEGMILDPGGHKVYSALFPQIASLMPIKGLKYIFFSHQDPDIIAAANGWLMVTDAEAYLSGLWMRFITHFGVDELAVKRIKPIPDEGMNLTIGDAQIKLIPAHFLHSAGNFQVYDTVSKILYSGDLGASLGQTYSLVENFDEHIQYMEGFHKRYLPTRKALQMWVNTVRKLDIEMIAPQHGAIFGNRELSNRFIDWLEGLSCGLDLMGDEYPIP